MQFFQENHNDLELCRDELKPRSQNDWSVSAHTLFSFHLFLFLDSIKKAIQF